MRYQYPYPELFDGVPRPDIRALSGNLAIYGAGFQGLLAAQLLEERGIEVLCFCDRDGRKQGTVYHGLPVLSPEEMKRRWPGAVPIVTPYSLSPAWRYVTGELGYAGAITPFSLFLDFDSAGFDRLAELPAWYHPASLDAHMDFFLLRCVNLLTEHHLLSAELSVTEVCNLRCRHCNALMPCYPHPRASGLPELLDAVSKLLNGRRFHHIFIEGGEPFLWRPLSELLRFLDGRAEVMRVIPITNGTVVPDEALLEALRLPKVTVRMSDYGALSRTGQIAALFERNHVKYWLYQQQWYALDSFRKEPARGDELEWVRSSCCKLEGSCGRYVADGKLFNCPEQGNLHKLGLFPSGEEEYVDLAQEDSPALQQKISRYFDAKGPWPVPKLCAHCKGRGLGGVEVAPAEQLEPGETIQVRFE